MFAPNMERPERRVRIGLGIIILLLGAFYESGWAFLGLIPIATGVTGWCGLYALLDKLGVPRPGASKGKE